MSLLHVLRYKQAAFCYEELILSQPMNPLYHLTYADVSNVPSFLLSSQYLTLSLWEIKQTFYDENVSEMINCFNRMRLTEDKLLILVLSKGFLRRVGVRGTR